MRNVQNIARKELVDLLSSKMVIVILSGYFLVVLFSILYLYNTLSGGGSLEYGNSIGMAFSNNLFSMLAKYYGPIVGVMIGCMSIASERHKNALNTLLVKPVYRDTIINGKLLGSLAFLALVIGVTIAFYTSGLLVLCGDALAPTLGDYVSRLPIVFIFSMILISIFLAISVLLSILIKSQAFAIIMGAIVVYLSNTIEIYSGIIARFFPGRELYVHDLITSLTPTSRLLSVRNNLFDSSCSAWDSFQMVLPDMLKFLLYVVILCIASYIVFIRRDVD